MPVFNYRGRNKQGEIVKGLLDADDENSAADQLMQRAIIPIEITEVNEVAQFDLMTLFGRKVDLDELLIFTRQMYSLTRSGIPLLRAIGGLAETTTSEQMRKALQNVGEQLAGGRSLSSALNMHQDIFDPLFISMIHVGENTGKLEDIFAQLSIYIEREQETRKRIKSALRYPIFVLGAIVVALSVLNILVIPKFADMFSRFGADLPLPTKILITTSNIFINYWPIMLLVVGGLITGFRFWKKSYDGSRKWDKVKMHFPAVGSIVERSTLSRYCRSFSMMLNAGVPMTQALSLSADAVDNAYMHDRIINMRRGIEAGDSMLRVSNQSKMFTPLVLQMVAVGEETGQIDQLLNDAADFYEGEVDYDLKNLTASLEPILIGIVASIVLVLALGIYLPMWDMLNVVKGAG